MVVGIGKMASGSLGSRSAAQHSSRGRMSLSRVGLRLRIEKFFWKNVQVKRFELLNLGKDLFVLKYPKPKEKSEDTCLSNLFFNSFKYLNLIYSLMINNVIVII